MSGFIASDLIGLEAYPGNDIDRLTLAFGSNDNDLEPGSLKVRHQALGRDASELAISRNDEIRIKAHRIDFCLEVNGR